MISPRISLVSFHGRKQKACLLEVVEVLLQCEADSRDLRFEARRAGLSFSKHWQRRKQAAYRLLSFFQHVLPTNDNGHPLPPPPNNALICSSSRVCCLPKIESNKKLIDSKNILSFNAPAFSPNSRRLQLSLETTQKPSQDSSELLTLSGVHFSREGPNNVFCFKMRSRRISALQIVFLLTTFVTFLNTKRRSNQATDNCNNAPIVKCHSKRNGISAAGPRISLSLRICCNLSQGAAPVIEPFEMLLC